MDNSKLVAYINRHNWWRTAVPSNKSVKARGVFYASSFREAEFYGRPLDTPFRVSIRHPLFGSEVLIAHSLGLSVPGPDISIKARFALDGKMAVLARRKGYDAIVLVSPTAYHRYTSTGAIPRSIELNVLK